MNKEDCQFCKGNTIHWDFCEKGCRPMGLMLTLLGGDEKEKDDGIWLENGIELKYDNSSGEYVPQGIEISYCPFCGTKLEAKEES